MAEHSSGAGKRLTVHNASITTMTVEVKTVTIGARQVTQGIFRQLIEEPLIADNGTLNGAPWGHVTWHPDKCDRTREHWHIVWQRGSELRRAKVSEVPDFDEYLRTGGSQKWFWCPELDLRLSAAVREWLHGRRRESPVVLKPGYGASHEERYPSPTDHGFTAYAIASEAAVAAIKAKAAAMQAAKIASDLGTVKRRAAEADTALADATARLEAEIGQTTYQEIADAVAAATSAEAQRRQRHRDIHAALAELPQLFIGG